MTLTAPARRALIVQQQTLALLGATKPPPQPVLLKAHAADVSNYTSWLRQDVLTAWRDQHDIGLVIVQAVDPPLAYPPTQTRQQLMACEQAGITTDIYLYLWTNSNVEQDMRTKLALCNGLEGLVRKVWLDVEDTAPASVAARVRSIRQGLAVCDGWAAAHGKPRTGLYSGKWWWDAYLAGTTEFSDRPLWASQYDGVQDTAAFNRFGGWSSCAIKQYAGSSVLAGQGGVDLNILSDAERAA